MTSKMILTAVILSLATLVLGWGLIANWTTREWWQAMYDRQPRLVRRVMVGVAGIAILALAIALSPLPGPGGLPLAYLALTVLGAEFLIAKRIKTRLDGWIKTIFSRVKRVLKKETSS